MSRELGDDIMVLEGMPTASHGLGDDIMILEGLGQASMSATKSDLLGAIADFPINAKEQLLSGINESEDSLNDIVPLSQILELGDLGRRPRHRPARRPSHRPSRRRPYPVPYYDYPIATEPSMVVVEQEEEAEEPENDLEWPRRRHHRRGYRASYPYPVYPTSVEPSIVVVEKEDDEPSDDLEAVYQAVSTNPVIIRRKKRGKKGAYARHIRRLEAKMKDLHPSKVKLTAKGVEGFGAVVPAGGKFKSPTKVIYQIGAIVQAAKNPNSYQAKTIIANLKRKADDLDALAKGRLELARKSITDYRKDKSFVDKLERVARAKAIPVLRAAKQRLSGRAVERKMDREIKDVRRLHDRSVGIGRRAVHSMKTYALASMLSKNTSGQSFVTKATRLAIMGGKPEAARVLAEAMNKHAETARAIKATRQKQTELWKSESTQHKYDRLASRRERMLKAVAILNAKARQGSLSEEDKKALRDAYAQIYRIEVAMIGLQGGVRVIPESVEPKKYQPAGITLSDFQETPGFSVEVPPNDPSGAFLQDIGVIFNTTFSVGPKTQNVEASIGAIFEPSFTIGVKPLRVESSFGAIRETDFSVRPKPLNVAASFSAIRETDIAIKPKPLNVAASFGYTSVGKVVEPRFTAQMIQPPVAAIFEGSIKEPQFSVQAAATNPYIGRWLENFALGWFSDSGDMVDDTATSLADLLKGVKGWDAPIDCEGCSVDGFGANIPDIIKKMSPALAKKVEAAEATYGKFTAGKKTEDVLNERTATMKKRCNRSCPSCEWKEKWPSFKHSKNAYLAKGNIGKWVIKGKDGKEHLDPEFIKDDGIWCKINPEGKDDQICAIHLIRSGPRKGRWISSCRNIPHEKKDSGNILDKIGKAITGTVSKIGKVAYNTTKSVVTNTFKAAGKIASGGVNMVKTVAATSYNTLKSISKGDLEGAAKALYKGTKGVAGETWRQAKGVYNYAKSQFNSVCSMVSDGAVRQIGTAAAAAATGGAGAAPAAMAMKYSNKICGAASGVEKAVAAIGRGDVKNAVKALAKTGKGLVNVPDLIEAAGVPLPDVAKAAIKNAGSVDHAANILKNVIKDKKASDVLAVVGAAPSAFYKSGLPGSVPLLTSKEGQKMLRKITTTERKAAAASAMRNARKALGLSGDIYDIAAAMDRRNLMARKVERVMARMSPEKRQRMMANKKFAAMIRRARAGKVDPWNGGRAQAVRPWDGISIEEVKYVEPPYRHINFYRPSKYVSKSIGDAPTSWNFYRPTKMVTRSIGEIPYVEPPYKKYNLYRQIRVNRGFGQLPGGFPQLYEKVTVVGKNALGEVKYVEPKYRRMRFYNPMKHVTATIEDVPTDFPEVQRELMSLLEGAAIAAPLLLT